MNKMSIQEYRKKKPGKNPKFGKKVYACHVCQERLQVTKAEMKRTAMIYHCSKGHQITHATVWTFDSKMEFKAWHEFLLRQKAGEIRNLKHHEKFQLTPEFWEKVNYKYSIYMDESFEEWYAHHVDYSPTRPKNEKDWIYSSKQFYESDITYEDRSGLHVIEVKNLDRKTKRPYFPGTESEKKLARVARYLEMWYGLRLEVYTGEWWDFHNGRLVKRG